jgi:hypothetical protein
VEVRRFELKSRVAINERPWKRGTGPTNELSDNDILVRAGRELDRQLGMVLVKEFELRSRICNDVKVQIWDGIDPWSEFEFTSKAVKPVKVVSETRNAPVVKELEGMVSSLRVRVGRVWRLMSRESVKRLLLRVSEVRIDHRLRFEGNETRELDESCSSTNEVRPARWVGTEPTKRL